jgi:hypothetical protein
LHAAWDTPRARAVASRRTKFFSAALQPPRPGAYPLLQTGAVAAGIVVERTVDSEALLPIVMFLCLTYVFKAVLDAVIRHRMLRMDLSVDYLRAMIENERRQSRIAALRWGLALVALAGAFAVIQAFGWREITPGAIAALAAAVGLAQLVFFVLARRLD